jgi:hypothetical protein
MKTQEKIKLIEDVVKHYKELNNSFDQIYTLFGNAESKFTQTVWNAFDAYVSSISKLIDDPFDYINWYIFENGCGEKKLECGFKGKKYKIKKVRDLVKFIELVK